MLPSKRSSRRFGARWNKAAGVSIEVRLPQWGMGMQEGTVVRWLKHEGDAVQADENLVEIEADAYIAT